MTELDKNRSLAIYYHPLFEKIG